MNFGFVASLIVIIFAVLSVFIEIPIVSNYAFWFAVGAYIMLAGTGNEISPADGRTSLFAVASSFSRSGTERPSSSRRSFEIGAGGRGCSSYPEYPDRWYPSAYGDDQRRPTPP